MAAASGSLPDPSGSSPQRAEVEAGLRSANTQKFNAAVHAAVRLGAEGDQLLAALSDLRGWRAIHRAAALGDVVGPSGGEVLRRIIATPGPGTSDQRCAALLALAKREKARASDALFAVVDDRDAGVREYALLGLAAVGDERARDVVFKRLEAILRSRQRHIEPIEHVQEVTPVVLAAVYLLRHAGDKAQVERLSALLRRRRERLSERERQWFVRYWPSLDPDAAPSPDLTAPEPDTLQRWLLADPLFSRPATA
jgi:hypothetical protein